jgi:nickel transport protein
MKRLIFIIILGLSFLSLLPRYLWAHGVVYEISKENAVIVKIGYDDGEPMSYAEVKIFSPLEREPALSEVEGIEYQNGRTDRNGCFAFFPDQAGEWRVVVNDGMGHGLVTEVPVKEGMNLNTIHHGFPRGQKLITGIGIIWGLTGLVLYLKLRKRTA